MPSALSSRGPALARVWSDPTQMLWELPLSFICKRLGACALKPDSPVQLQHELCNLRNVPHFLCRATKGPISYNCYEAAMRTHAETGLGMLK